MIDFKKVYVETFKALKNDTKLLDLLEIEYKDIDPVDALENIRRQIQETSRIEDLLTENSTKLAIHEGSQGYRSGMVDCGYLQIDVNITKDNNKEDRRALIILNRLIDILDCKQRERHGLPALKIGLDGLTYKTKTLETRNTATGWEKFTVVFSYKYML